MRNCVGPGLLFEGKSPGLASWQVCCPVARSSGAAVPEKMFMLQRSADLAPACPQWSDTYSVLLGAGCSQTGLLNLLC